MWTHEVSESPIQHCFSKAALSEIAVNWDPEEKLPLSKVRNSRRALEMCGNIDSNFIVED